MTFKVAQAVDFNDGQISNGKLTWEHIAHLVHQYQVSRGLEPHDGMAGDRVTIPDIERYIDQLEQEARELAAPAAAQPFAGMVHPIPNLHGRPARISCPFGDRRKHPVTGLWSGHGGGDDAFLATDEEIALRVAGKLPKESFNGNEKSDDPAVRYRWYMPSVELEIAILAQADGLVRIAGWGVAKNGEKVIELVVDYGNVAGVGAIAVESLHCKRLLPGIKPGARVKRGQPLAIVGKTGTNKNHRHGEVWSDAQWDKDGRAERLEKVDPAPIYAQMVRYDYRPPVGQVTFDERYLIAA